MFSMLEALAYKRGFEPDDEGRLAAGLAWPHVLDLFAGSGALGIEALSRGAVIADFVESNRAACEVIARNLAATELTERARVYQQGVASALPRIPTPVDLVFADPPYEAIDALAATLTALGAPGVLQPSSVLLLEQAAAAPPPPDVVGPLRRQSTRRHGRTQIVLYAGPD
jgi:16S rRNA (guanine966-N2)-methyltransferase